MAAPYSGMEDPDMDSPEGEVIDDGAHEKLLNSIFALDGKKRQNNVVRGISSASSSLDLIVHANKESTKIQPQDLQLKNANFTSELKRPMNELETAKAKRQIAREGLVTEFSKWDPVVRDIRAAPQTIYSKREHGIKMHQALQPKPFVPRTSLELELYAALGKSEDILRPNEVMTVAEEKALKAMSIKEARARRAELLKHRELLSRMELKAKRMKRIKSKRYRKVLRKERIATEKKELEQLQKTDPEAFVEKMELLERARVEERLTLKHRGGGKFSRMHKAYSKFDDKTRAAMQDMLQKSRELTKKRQDVSSSDDDEEDVRNVNREDNDEDGKMSEDREKAINQMSSELRKSVQKKGGGWLDGPHTEFIYNTEEKQDVQQAKEASVVDNSSRAAYDDEKTELEGSSVRECVLTATNKDKKESLETTNISKSNSSDGFTDDDSDKTNCKKRKLDFKHEGSSSETKSTGNLTTLEDEDDVEQEEDGSLLSQTQLSKSTSTVKVNAEEKVEGTRKRKRRKKKSQTGNEEVLQNENNKSSGAKPLKEVTLTPVDEEHSDKDEVDDDEDVMKVTMEELFEDEDLVEAFAKEKADEEKKRRPKIEDARLPGWGSWAGPDYKEDAAKRLLNKKRKGKQKPVKKGNIKQPYVWLNPDREASIRKLQPKKVPFPYTSVQQYEASLRQPISRGFVRETAFKLLTKPEVVTKQGHIIKPLNKDDHFEEKDISAEDDDKNFGFIGQKKTTNNIARKKNSRPEKKQERKSLS